MSESLSEDPAKPKTLRNALLGISTPTVLAFATDGQRRFGANAVIERSSNAITFKNLVHAIGANAPFKAEELKLPFDVYDDVAAEIMSPSNVLGMFLRNVIVQCESIDTTNAKDTSTKPSPTFVFVLPVSVLDSFKNAFGKAVKFAGLDLAKCSVCSVGHALACAYVAKHEWLTASVKSETGEKASDKNSEEEKTEASKTLSKDVLVVDHGYKQFTVVLIRATGGSFAVVREVCIRDHANEAMDVALFRHFSKKIITKYPKAAAKKIDDRSSKMGARLLRAVEKAKKTLSAVAKTTFVIDNVCDRVDARLSCTRDDLAQICSEPCDALARAVKDVAASALGPIDSVEMCGGGSRSPLLQQAVRNGLHVDEKEAKEITMTFTLDITVAAASGGAIAGATEDSACQPLFPGNANKKTEEENSSTIGTTGVDPLEKRLAAHDAARQKDKALVNAFESFLYKWKETLEENHDDIDNKWLRTLLDDAENWFFDSGVNAGGAVCEAKRVELETSIREKCAKHLDRVAAARAESDRSLEALAATAAAEAKAQEHANIDEEDDRDRRKMKTSARLRKAKKNKDEGNELFRDGNLLPAAKRYVKALQHCDKCYDINPKEQEEIDALEVSLRLNLAMCWLKLKKYEKVVDNCDRALKIDAKNVKGYYRRGTAYEKMKKHDLAKKDAATALQLKPDDKASKKLAARVNKALLKQKERAKKMAKRMFG